MCGHAARSPPALAHPDRPRQSSEPRGCRAVAAGVLGRKIVEALPHLIVIGWETLVADKAATVVAQGFYEAVARGVCSRYAIFDAHNAAVAAFD